MDLLVGLIEFVLALVFLILLHEFGHFIAAKFFKIEVEEFGIGFPPRIKTLFKWRETEFTLNAVPLGGFVRPKGENDPSVPGGLAAANPWKRLVVLFAGPIMNLLFGVLLTVILFTGLGTIDTTVALVDSIAVGSPAEQAGLQANDLIVEVNGIQIDPASDVWATDQVSGIIFDNLGQPVSIIYERDGSQAATTLTPRENPPEGQGPIGISMTGPRIKMPLGEAVPAGFATIYEYGKALLQLPFKLIGGTASPEEGQVVGLVGMFDMFQQTRQQAPENDVPVFWAILMFTTTITISLGFLNLVPFPALDGGRILFTLPEIIIRKRIPPNYENVINLVGFGLLILLMLYVNLKDIINLIGGGNG